MFARPPRRHPVEVTRGSRLAAELAEHPDVAGRTTGRAVGSPAGGSDPRGWRDEHHPRTHASCLARAAEAT
jgi:hypothetical protein